MATGSSADLLHSKSDTEYPNVISLIDQNIDFIVTNVRDPNALAEEFCRADLILPEMIALLTNNPTLTDRTKVMTILSCVVDVVSLQPYLSQSLLTVLQSQPELSSLFSTFQAAKEKVTACVGDESGVPSESTDCISGPVVQLTADANSSVSKDEHNAIPTQQEDNGRSGGPSNTINMGCSTDHVKAINDAPKLHQLEYLEQHSLTIKTINRVAAEWKTVALHLHFEGYHIKVIERDCHYQSNSACRTMFNQWLEGSGREPRTWRTLIAALGEADLHDIAEDLRNVLSDNFSAADSNQAIQDSSPAVVCRKRPLEKSTEEAAEKHPRLESSKASEPNSTNPHSADLAIDNPLMKHRPKLAAFYSHQPEVPEGAWPPVKKTQYINLALIRTEQTIDFNKEFLRQTIRGSVDDIMKDKDDIKYDDILFTDPEVDEGARLVFEGRPGCGKMTMMNKVSQDWAKWKIFSSCLLFLVHLRRFGNRSDIDLEIVLRYTPVNFSDEEFQQIRTQIEGKGAIFALDCLDEYCPEKKKYISTFIHKLICGEVLPKSIVIAASRPAASQKYRRNATKCIKVLGFLKQEIYEYIDSYFVGDKNKVLGLRTYLEYHPNVMHMCYLPLHMAMVTYLYEVEGTSLPQTETEIYKHFTLSTLLRSIRMRGEMEVDEEEFSLSSFDDLQQEDKIVFDLILELAYQSTVVNPKQVFSADDVKRFANGQSNNTGSDRNSLGLVVVDKYFVRYGLKEIYTFLHLTFQEFLAACHIARLSS